jgi:hypothetical protein
MVDACIAKLKIEKPHIEVRIVGRHHATRQGADEIPRDFVEPRRLSDIGIRDPMDFGGPHGARGVHQGVENQPRLPVAVHAHDGDLDDTVQTRSQTRCLQVHNGDGGFFDTAFCNSQCP